MQPMARKFLEHLQSPAPQLHQAFNIVEEAHIAESEDLPDPEDSLDRPKRGPSAGPHKVAKLARLQIGPAPAFPFDED